MFIIKKTQRKGKKKKRVVLSKKSVPVKNRDIFFYLNSLRLHSPSRTRLTNKCLQSLIIIFIGLVIGEEKQKRLNQFKLH